MSCPDDLFAIYKLREIYDEGKPLFTRDILEDINRHMDEGKENAHKIDEEYRARCPEDQTPRLGIGYQSFECMTILRPNSEDRPSARPVYTMYPSITRNLATLEELQEALNKYRKEWLESKTRCSLLEQISLESRTDAWYYEDRWNWPGTLDEPRAHTVADALKKRNGGREIECYAQDPENDQDVVVEFLRTTGITSPNDPKGFLEVDANTFVVSVSPNIPVRQIVCDIARPRAMLWNIVKKEEYEEWKQELVDGELTWVSPYTTDPVSDRVVEMAEHYTEFPFNDAEGWFGEMAMYVRKD